MDRAITPEPSLPGPLRVALPWLVTLVAASAISLALWYPRQPAGVDSWTGAAGRTDSPFLEHVARAFERGATWAPVDAAPWPLAALLAPLLVVGTALLLHRCARGRRGGHLAVLVWLFAPLSVLLLRPTAAAALAALATLAWAAWLWRRSAGAALGGAWAVLAGATLWDEGSVAGALERAGSTLRALASEPLPLRSGRVDELALGGASLVGLLAILGLFAAAALALRQRSWPAACACAAAGVLLLALPDAQLGYAPALGVAAGVTPAALPVAAALDRPGDRLGLLLWVCFGATLLGAVTALAATWQPL